MRQDRLRLSPARAARIVAFLAAVAAPAAAREPTPVDLQLVLAVDVSDSMDPDEQQLQREGYLDAIVSKPVLDAIRRGGYGRIALAYVEWAGADDQRTVVHWSLIDGPQSAQGFAAKLAAVPLHRAARTSISGAIAHSAALFSGSGFSSARRVIDISGDGPSNEGAPVEQARDAATAAGVTINGLPLTLKPSTYAAAADVALPDYYRDCVIGGPSSFVLPVDRLEQFPDAIKTKLVREIAGLGDGRRPKPLPVAAHAKPTDCARGERLWEE